VETGTFHGSAQNTMFHGKRWSLFITYKQKNGLSTNVSFNPQLRRIYLELEKHSIVEASNDVMPPDVYKSPNTMQSTQDGEWQTVEWLTNKTKHGNNIKMIQ